MKINLQLTPEQADKVTSQTIGEAIRTLENIITLETELLKEDIETHDALSQSYAYFADTQELIEFAHRDVPTVFLEKVTKANA